VARRREGDWFAFPLGDAGYAVGLIARAPKRGDVLFGYFFGPLRSELPSAMDVESLTPSDAVLLLRFFDEASEDNPATLVPERRIASEAEAASRRCAETSKSREHERDDQPEIAIEDGTRHFS
jgi:hypothetical protein